MTPKALAWSMLAFALCVAGCSLTLDTNKKACTKNDNCGAPYVCEQGLCVYKTGCASDADCRKLEPTDLYKNTICDTKTHQCLAAECLKTDDCENGGYCDTAGNRCVTQNKTTCSKDAECTHYDGLPICSGGRCGEAECRTKDDCKGETATTTCMGGKCVDPVWGCIGEPDDRPKAMSQTSTYRVQVWGVLTQAAISDLHVDACAQLDQHCDNPLTTVKITHDKSTGWVTVANLQQDAPIHLHFKSADYFETDYYVQRLTRDITEEPLPILLIPPNLVPSIGSAVGIDVNTTDNGTLIARFFDCQDPPKPGAGLALSVSETQSDTEVFYVDEGNIPLPDAQESSSYGAAGIANMKRDRQVTLRVTLEGKTVSSFAVTPYAGRMAYVNLYPRDYGAQ